MDFSKLMFYVDEKDEDIIKYLLQLNKYFPSRDYSDLCDKVYRTDKWPSSSIKFMVELGR